jgi:hypothetical protein
MCRGHEIMNYQCRAAIIFVILFVLAPSIQAKRKPPKPVVPITANGIKYDAAGDGRDQYVVATDLSTGKQLWTVKVFHTRIKFWIEEDVQWIFIANLKIIDDALLVRDEKARCYSIDLKKRKVRRVSCAAIVETTGKDFSK